jgi:hypothetical protein
MNTTFGKARNFSLTTAVIKGTIQDLVVMGRSSLQNAVSVASRDND